MLKIKRLLSTLLITALCLGLLPNLPAKAADEPAHCYVPVESAEDFYLGGEYLLVAEARGKHYALACQDPSAERIFDFKGPFYSHFFYYSTPVEINVGGDGTITQVPDRALRFTFHETALAGRGSDLDYFILSMQIGGNTRYLTGIHDSHYETIGLESHWNPRYTTTAFKAVMLPDGQSSVAPYYLMSDGSGNLMDTPSTHIRFYTSLTLKDGSLLSCPSLPANCFYIDGPESLGYLGKFGSTETDENGNPQTVWTEPGGYDVVDAPVKLYRRSDRLPPAHQGSFTGPEGITITMVELEPHVYTVKLSGSISPDAEGMYLLPLTWHLPAGSLNVYSMGGNTLEEAKTRTFSEASGYSPDIPSEQEFLQLAYTRTLQPEFEDPTWWNVFFPANFNGSTRVQAGEPIYWKPDFSGLSLLDAHGQPLPGIQAGETHCVSLTQAFHTAPDPDGWVRIKLLGDRDYFNPRNFSTNFKVPENTKVELDLNGHYLRLNSNGRLTAAPGSQLVIVNTGTDSTSLCGIFSDGSPLFENQSEGSASIRAKAGLYHSDITGMAAEGCQIGEISMPFTWYDAYYGQDTVKPNCIKTELQPYYLVTPVGTRLSLTSDGRLTGAFAGAQPLVEGVKVSNPIIDNGYSGTIKERTEIALRRSGANETYTTVLPAAVRKTFAAYGPSLRADHSFGSDTVSLILPSETLTAAQEAAEEQDLSLTLQRSACSNTLVLSAWSAEMRHVAPDAPVNLEFSAENGQDYRLYLVEADGSTGAELGAASAYEGKVCFEAQAGQLASFALVKGCLHSHMQHSAEVRSGCMENGTLAYWYCPACRHYYQDAAGTLPFENASSPGDLRSSAPGHKDENDDGICDVCLHTMPTFVPVTNQDEIKAGEIYLPVIRDAGRLYGLHTITQEQVMEYIYPDTKLPATAALTPEADGSIRYKTMKQAGGMLLSAKAPYSTHDYPLTGEGLCLWADPCGIWRAFDVTDSDYAPLRFGFAPNDKYNVYDILVQPDGSVLLQGIVSQGGSIVGAKDGGGNYYFHISDGAGGLVPYGYGGKGKPDGPVLTRSGALLLYRMVTEDGTKPQPQVSEYGVRVRNGTARAPGYVENKFIRARAGAVVSLKTELAPGAHFVRWEASHTNEWGGRESVSLAFSSDTAETTFIMPDMDLELVPVVRLEHTHTLGNRWQDGKTGHYRQCTSDGCMYRTAEEPHTFQWVTEGTRRTGTCTLCGHQVTQFLSADAPLSMLPSPYEATGLTLAPAENKSVSYNPSAAAAIRETAERAGAASLSLTLQETDSTDAGNTPQQNSAIAAAKDRNPMAYEISLQCKDSGGNDLRKISYFGKTGMATITVPYQPGLNGEIRVSRIAADGTVEPVPCRYDREKGLVSWDSGSHSLYLITSSDPFLLSVSATETGVVLALDGGQISDGSRCIAAAYRTDGRMEACGMAALEAGQDCAEIALGLCPKDLTLQIFLTNADSVPLLPAAGPS